MKIGLFADLHYAKGLVSGTRQCGQSLQKLQRILNKLGDADLFINLGDALNEGASQQENLENLRAFQDVLAASGKPVYHVLGNHDTHAFPRSALLACEPEGGYTFMAGETCCLVLDGNYTKSGLSYYQIDWDWTDTSLPESQIHWLERRLNQAAGSVIVFCHQNLDIRPNDPHVVANADRIERMLERSGKVAAVIQGHYHPGYFQRIHGIPYYTLKAVCEGDGCPCAMMEIGDGEPAIQFMEA
jgi:UDP-2,3-diacylglucosamine pyrophosphatase LpxH